MKTKDILLVSCIAILIIGVTAAVTFSIGQNANDEDEKAYIESLNPDILYYDHLDQDIHDIALPDSLEFCGESIPLDRFYVRESLEREILVNAHLHSSTMLLLKRTSRWFPVIVPIMTKNGLPEDFKYLAVIESALTNAVSPSKAVGFWQFLESTGKEYNLEINKEVDMRYNQELETVAACKYLKDSYRKFGSWILAAAAFNCGNGRITKTIEEQRVTSYFDMLLPAETERYVYRILALKLIIEDPAKYGYHISDEGWYQPLEYSILTVTESIPDLIEFAINNGTNLKMLKYYNPWLRGTSLTISEGNSYKIKLPK